MRTHFIGTSLMANSNAQCLAIIITMPGSSGFCAKRALYKLEFELGFYYGRPTL
jgi:hypothetical protein